MVKGKGRVGHLTYRMERNVASSAPSRKCELNHLADVTS